MLRTLRPRNTDRYPSIVQQQVARVLLLFSRSQIPPSTTILLIILVGKIIRQLS